MAASIGFFTFLHGIKRFLQFPDGIGHLKDLIYAFPDLRAELKVIVSVSGFHGIDFLFLLAFEQNGFFGLHGVPFIN